MEDHAAVLNTIDLSNPDIHQSAALLKQACADSGFFYVINHGISEEFLNEVFSQAKKFFALPENEKMKVACKNSPGYAKNLYFDQETNQRSHGEIFRMIQELPGSDQDAQKPFGGPNPWPSADVLPAWKETMLKYQQEMINLGKAVARIIAVALDVNEDFFDQPNLLGNALSYYNFNHYDQYGASNKYTLGTLAHSDIFIITILATNDVPGLQICKNIDANPRVWENVLPLKGAFVINIGDMLQWMSNGLFRSTKHRVLFREDRYSLACFISPSLEGTIECIPSCKSAENPPKYPPIKCEEFIANVYKKRGDDQNISDHTKL